MTEPTVEPIGRGWIAALLALSTLLVAGITLYLRMSAPILSHSDTTGYNNTGARQRAR